MTRWLSPEKIKGEPSDWRALLSSDVDLPLPLREFNRAFRRTWLNSGCTLFLQLKAIADANDQRIGDFLKATTDDGGILNYEIDQKKKDPNFVCTKCHITFGREAIPEDHLKTIPTPKAKVKPS